VLDKATGTVSYLVYDAALGWTVGPNRRSAAGCIFPAPRACALRLRRLRELCNPGDAASLSQAILRVLDRDWDRAAIRNRAAAVVRDGKDAGGL